MADKKSREVYEGLKEALKTYKGGWDGIELDNDDTLTFHISGKEYRFQPVVDTAPDISVKVTADVAEAITGFKALQRELRETTKAAREYEDAIESIDGNFRLGTSSGSLSVVLDGKAVGKVLAPDLIDVSTKEDEMTYYDLSEVPTKQLHEELTKRTNVFEYTIGPHGDIVKIVVDTEREGYTELIEGPARIIVNKN